MKTTAWDFKAQTWVLHGGIKCVEKRLQIGNPTAVVLKQEQTSERSKQQRVVKFSSFKMAQAYRRAAEMVKVFIKFSSHHVAP